MPSDKATKQAEVSGNSGLEYRAGSVSDEAWRKRVGKREGRTPNSE